MTKLAFIKNIAERSIFTDHSFSFEEKNLKQESNVTELKASGQYSSCIAVEYIYYF